MSTNIGTLSAQAVLDAQGFTSGAQKISAQAKQTAASVQSSFNSAFRGGFLGSIAGRAGQDLFQRAFAPISELFNSIDSAISDAIDGRRMAEFTRNMRHLNAEFAEMERSGRGTGRTLEQISQILDRDIPTPGINFGLFNLRSDPNSILGQNSIATQTALAQQRNAQLDFQHALGASLDQQQRGADQLVESLRRQNELLSFGREEIERRNLERAGGMHHHFAELETEQRIRREKEAQVRAGLELKALLVHNAEQREQKARQARAATPALGALDFGSAEVASLLQRIARAVEGGEQLIGGG
ncbi:MAG: hypothetical protein L0Y72_23600 [Gemmataceae bacterium]|nr:hypothetical protein [Gemmataceae bacterium]MCI0742030.1 hypothetical protein [Gemmataceae bacterium]